jgi:hypothetical protein
MKTDLLNRNRAQLLRLRALVQDLNSDDLRLEAGDGWTIGACLAHLAFWDCLTMKRWERYAAEGVFTDVPQPVRDLINDAGLQIWLAVPGNVAAAMALATAAEIVETIESLPVDAVAAAESTGRPRLIDRSLHWNEHQDQIERALIASHAKQ